MKTVIKRGSPGGARGKVSKSQTHRISRIAIGKIQITKPGYGGKGKIWLQRISGKDEGEGMDTDENHFACWIEKYFKRYM